MKMFRLLLVVSLIVFAIVPVRAAMPPHGPYDKNCHPDNVRAVAHGGVTVAFDCFSGVPATAKALGVQISFGPDEERYSEGGAGTSVLNIYVSAAPSCPHLHDGSTLALRDPCILVEETSSFLTLASTCAFKAMSRAVMRPPECAEVSAKLTSGSITFTRWATRPGGRLAFKFSKDARLTQLDLDIKAPGGVVEYAAPISGSAIVTLN